MSIFFQHSRVQNIQNVNFPKSLTHVIFQWMKKIFAIAEDVYRWLLRTVCEMFLSVILDFVYRYLFTTVKIASKRAIIKKRIKKKL